jgi:hypothetical protein
MGIAYCKTDHRTGEGTDAEIADTIDILDETSGETQQCSFYLASEHTKVN